MTSKTDGLSQEEFLRLQEQLIELRNTNYELKEKLKKAVSTENEPSSAKKDALQFASRLLNRSQEKEMQQRLEAEIDSMRLKLQQQEEEFRLQQQTFISELNKVVKQSECLQKELDGTRNGDISPSGYQQQIEEINLKLSYSIVESNRLRDDLEEVTKNRNELKEQLQDQINLVNVFENTVLDLRQQINKLNKDYENTIKAKESIVLGGTQAIDELKVALEQANILVGENTKEIRKNEETLSTLEDEKTILQNEMSSIKAELKKVNQDKQNLTEMYANAKKELEQHAQEAEETRKLHLLDVKRLENKLVDRIKKMESDLKEESRLQLEAKEAAHEAFVDNLKQGYEQFEKEVQNKWESTLAQRSQAFDSLNSQFYIEEKKLKDRIDQLTNELATKDDEKNLALKKQNHLIRELQKAVKEERKRADSVEKLKEKDWQVVDSDARSSNTYDGNESVSSLSALESDNVELINKLTHLQKSYSEVVDKLKNVEFENEALNKEILEKGEVIEDWIRSRPQMSSAQGTSQKNENPLLKFLATTLAGDEQITDLRDMNRKLQRMLEETLSKNIILQRDLQTLIERTEM